jgi:peptidoglycan/xylan/chitin deacetylase (PgdA/CDA1 family)
MRILHILSQTELTGAETYAAQLISSQVRDGHQVFVISDNVHTPIKAQLISLPISTASFWQRMQNIFKIRKFLKSEKIQVIHCHSRGAVRHAYWSRIGLPVGLTTSLHGQQHFSFSKKFFHLYGEILIAVCENIKSSMQKQFKTSESIIRVIRNPVADVVTGEAPINKTPRLALAGRSSGPKGKNFEILGLKHFKIWLDHIPGLRISIVAPHSERFSKNFQMHLAQLNAQYPGQILIEDRITNLAAHLANYDLVICSGRIAIETLMAGRKLLALGEFCSHGLIDKKNYSQARRSNFGDIGPSDTEANIDYQSISNQVLMFFQNAKEMTDNLSDKNDLKSIAEQDFSAEIIHRKVIEVYKGAIFKRQYPFWIPILMYHKIPDQEIQSRHRIFVSKAQFQKHLDFFKKNHFTTITFKELLPFWDLQKPMSDFPKKPLILSFDDGYVDNLINAQPLLKSKGMKANIFLLADHRILENTWDSETGEAPASLMSLEQKKQLDSEVFEIGSHGLNHIHLTENRSSALHEMISSKEQLEKDFHRSIVSFAYPFGSTDLDLAEECFLAGYRFAVNTDQGGLHLSDHPQFLFRVNIFPEENIWSLRKKTSRWYRKYFYNKRGR